MIIAKCNKCGKEIQELHCYRYVGRSNVAKYGFNDAGADFELCDDCHKFVQERVVSPVNKENQSLKNIKD